MKWTKEEKEQIIKWFNDNYFDLNFGSKTKVQVELFMFSMYWNHKINANESCTDSIMSKELGITTKKIKSLKEEKVLKYPNPNLNWVSQFVKCIPYAKYNEVKQLIQMNITDSYVSSSVRDYMSQNHLFDEVQLNTKLFQCRLDFFVQLCNSLPDENGNVIECQMSETAKAELAKIQSKLTKEKEIQSISKIMDGALKDGLKDLITSASKEVICAVLSTLPCGNIAKKAIDFCIQVVKGA